jgi:23S rRNA pseudouridine1911/1915/1917 synthase
VSAPRLTPPHPPRIIAETDDFLVVEKPPFLQAHPSKPSDTSTLWDELRGLLAFEIANGGQVSIINRLDRETSGITLVAKHHESARHFSMAMMRGEFRKEYLAIVHGHPVSKEWTVDGPLTRQGAIRPSRVWLRQCVDASGAAAFTGFRVEQEWMKDGAPFALVRAFPKTGRMHQIRVHLAESGNPIVGDKLYLDEGCYLEFIDTGWTPALAAKLLLPRQALHACRLSVGEWSWTSDLPGDLRDWMRGT